MFSLYSKCAYGNTEYLHGNVDAPHCRATPTPITTPTQSLSENISSAVDSSGSLAVSVSSDQHVSSLPRSYSSAITIVTSATESSSSSSSSSKREETSRDDRIATASVISNTSSLSFSSISGISSSGIADSFSNDCARCRTSGLLAKLRRSKATRTATNGRIWSLRSNLSTVKPTKGTAPLLSADGSTLLTEKTQILQRWTEHFRGVLNRPSVISDAAIERLPQVETNVDLDLPPSLQETIRAVQQLSSGKAPASDAIPAEVYKHGGPLLMDHPTALFQEMWRQGEVPLDFKDATIVHLYKRKGNRQVCDNYRGISLLNIAGNIFARILLNRLNNHLEQRLLSKSQCGFRRHRGTTDMILATRQLQEKCQEMRTHLYATLVDLTKSFDTVNREGLWKIMQKFGCPERFTQMVRQQHDGMMARVTDNGAVSEAFPVTNGVKQGYVLVPTLFSLMFSAMLMHAYRYERPGIRIAYRTDGHLLNQRRMNFQSRVSTTTVHELLFADD
nr:unnamed protein product [Spirometra erinaceieuropaei]